MDKIDRKIIETIKSLKNDPDFGGGLDFDGIHKLALARCGFNPNPTWSAYTWRDYLETYTWEFTHTMLRPLGAAVAIFVFAIIGWVSMANASVRALPGDTLYPVKLSMEKASLVLAFSADGRANLKVEFIGRRLEEMVEVAALRNSSPQTVQLAVERFKAEVSTIKNELESNQTVTETTKTELAKAVGRKTGAYSSTVASGAPELSREVDEILDETKEQAVEVVITANEEEQTDENAQELARALDNEIGELEDAYGQDAEEAIKTAKALQEQGNYRRAFQVLKEFRILQE